MSYLSEKNIEFIVNKVNESTIESSEMKEDLIDHFCCATEEEMKKGLSFEKSYELAFLKICPEGIDEIQKETVFLLSSRKNRALKLILYLSGCLTATAVTASIYFTVSQRQIPGSSIFLLVCLLLLTLLFLPSVFLNQYKKQVSKSFNQLVYLSGLLGLIFLMVSILFKIQHWAYGSIFLLASLLLLMFLFIPSIFLVQYKRQVSKSFINKLIYLSSSLGVFFLMVSILFKIQHWAYISYPLITSMALINFAIFPMLFFKMYRKS